MCVSPTAVLLIAHGSRRNEANDDLVLLAESVRARTAYPIVEIAYLELAEPTIPLGARRCIDLGAKEVLMMPFFLSAGEHVRDDLDRYRHEFGGQFDGVTFRLCEPLGLHPLLTEVVLARLEEGASR